MTRQINQVFLIDDDPMSNLINRSLLRKYHWQAEAVIFNDGPGALQALRELAAKGELWPEVILLDMEMPAYDGWDFMADYGQLPEHYISRCLLYMLSSSINPHDIGKARSLPLLKAYLTKPLTLAGLNQIQEEYEKLPG